MNNAVGLVEAKPASTRPGSDDSVPGTELFCIYTGSSMEPTLQTGDLLEVLPYKKEMIRVGDVISYRPPGKGRLTVHRVVDNTKKGLSSQGDNNSSQDPYLLTPEDVDGQVVAAWRSQQRRKIPGGQIGLLLISLWRRIRFLDQRICAMLYPFYVASSHSGIARFLLPAHLKPRVIVFQANECSQLRLLLGRHVIGYYEDNWGRWIIRRPFRLFVDERPLPNPRDFGKS